MTEKTFPAEINELAQVLVFLEEELDKAGTGPKNGSGCRSFRE